MKDVYRTVYKACLMPLLDKHMLQYPTSFCPMVYTGLQLLFCCLEIVIDFLATIQVKVSVCIAPFHP